MKEQLERAEQGVAALLAERNERWYPTFHIAAKAGWISDPNGLSYFNGRYQGRLPSTTPSAPSGAPCMGTRLQRRPGHRRREPIAMAPSIEADRDGVFSGSAVVGDDGKLYAYYTGHRWRNGINEDEGTWQVQCLATSQDGLTFEKQGVLVECPEGSAALPRPEGLANGRHLVHGLRRLLGRQARPGLGYTSTEMSNWEFDWVIFQDPNPDAYMLECPDMFPLGDKWVIFDCPMGPKKNGYEARNGHNAGYVVGTGLPAGSSSSSPISGRSTGATSSMPRRPSSHPTDAGSPTAGWAHSPFRWPPRRPTVVRPTHRPARTQLGRGQPPVGASDRRTHPPAHRNDGLRRVRTGRQPGQAARCRRPGRRDPSWRWASRPPRRSGWASTSTRPRTVVPPSVLATTTLPA